MMRTLRELEVRRLVFAALVAPLLLFSFFSVHTMPRFTGEGLDIVICTGAGFETIVVEKDDGSDEEPAHSPCDWSMQVHAATLPAAAFAVAPVVLDRPQALAFEKTILRSGKVNSGRFARAPPVSI